MKKLFLLSVFITTFSYSQITDENGTIATGINNTQLLGKIGIGLTNPTKELEVNGAIKGKLLIVDKDNYSDGFIAKFGEPVSPGGYSNVNIQRNSNDEIAFTMLNNNGTQRFWISLEDDISWMSLKDWNGQEMFKIARSLVDGFGTFLHLPKADSRIVIGGYGNYLLNEGHKLVIKNGSAMIEGNILTNANIGIGTDSFVDGTDIYRLSVNGKVRAHEIKVYTTWADFVFENDYNLPSLKEVENHIKEKGHLMDIPSAKEVEENGIELGEMNKLLLQKIEELTLYTIEQNKRIEALESKLNAN